MKIDVLNQAYKLPKMNLQLFAEGIDDGSDMFLDVEPTSETEETPEEEHEDELLVAENEPEETTDSPEDNPADKPSEQTIRIKYNGEEKDLSITEVTTLAQKGMNYDKVVRERDELRNSGAAEALKEFDLWAEESGMSRDDFTKHMTQSRGEAFLQKALAAVQAEFPDVPEQAALELAKARTAEKRQQNETLRTQAERAQQEEKLKPWRAFREKYPDIKEAKDLPPGVVDDITSGTLPIEAMLRHELAESKKELETARQQNAAEAKNKENKQKTPGSAASKGAETPADAFLLGFNT